MLFRSTGEHIRVRDAALRFVDALTPTWSEDGRYLAFRRPFQEDGSVRVIEPFGNSTQEVSTKTWSDPAWSPNGTSMCGVGPDVDGLDNDVRVFDALTFATKPFAAVQPPPGVHVAVTGCRYASAGTLAVWLAPDDEPFALEADLPNLPLVAVDFPVFRDGRGYSTAFLLRQRLGFTRELRAIGDVLRDQQIGRAHV